MNIQASLNAFLKQVCHQQETLCYLRIKGISPKELGGMPHWPPGALGWKGAACWPSQDGSGQISSGPRTVWGTHLAVNVAAWEVDT